MKLSIYIIGQCILKTGSKIVANKKACAKYKLTAVFTKIPTKAHKEKKTARKPSFRIQFYLYNIVFRNYFGTKSIQFKTLKLFNFDNTGFFKIEFYNIIIYYRANTFNYIQ